MRRSDRPRRPRPAGECGWQWACHWRRRGGRRPGSEVAPAGQRHARQGRRGWSRAGRRLHGEGAGLDATPARWARRSCFEIPRRRSAGGYLAGYAEPRGGGERIWYFSADGETPAVPAAAAEATAAFQRAIRVGPETGPGEYIVRLFLTRVPMSKSALLASGNGGDVLARREATLVIVPDGS